MPKIPRRSEINKNIAQETSFDYLVTNISSDFNHLIKYFFSDIAI